MRLERPYTLDGEMTLLLDFFAKYLPRERARDLLLFDHMSVNPSCYVPRALRREDPRLAKYKRMLEESHPLKSGVRRAIAILYSEECLAFADYDKKDPVTERYDVKTFKL